MPISKNIDYSEEHWRSVKQIIIEAMQNSKKYTIETKIVSESDESEFYNEILLREFTILTSSYVMSVQRMQM